MVELYLNSVAKSKEPRVSSHEGVVLPEVGPYRKGTVEVRSASDVADSLHLRRKIIIVLESSQTEELF